MTQRRVVVWCLACLVAGYLAASVPGFDPVHPLSHKPQRPLLKLVARLARVGLWMTVFAEPAPRPVEQQYAAAHCEGRSTICHAEGW